MNIFIVLQTNILLIKMYDYNLQFRRSVIDYQIMDIKPSLLDYYLLQYNNNKLGT